MIQKIRVEPLLPKRENWSKFNIKYIYSEEKLPYGEKLNTGVENDNECIQIMNQDDFFYENGFKKNMFNLLKTESR